MPAVDPTLWRDILSYLRRHHGEICRQWFEELAPLSLDGGLLTVRVHNSIQHSYLQNRCLDFFNDAAQSVTGALVALSFIHASDPAPAAPAPVPDPLNQFHPVPPRAPGVAAPAAAPVPSYPGSPADMVDPLLLSPDYTFENFVTGPDNRLAYAASIAVAQQPGKAYNPLFIHGGVGLGKTHLLQAICQTILAPAPQTKIVYMSCDSFMNQFLESVQINQMAEFRNRYRHVDVLIIDDIHFLTNRERVQEEFFHTFNTIYQSSKQIVLSSDSSPNEIPQLEERLISRFNWGLVARIDKPCYDTRVAILKKKSKLRGVELPDDVACHIAAKIDSNIRELEGAITKVSSLAMLEERPIDLPLALKALGDEPATPAGPALTIQNIIDAVTNFYGVKLSDLQGKRRQKSITSPRQVCMFLARKRTKYSLEEIGGYFGGRDHTTVMHAIEVISQRCSQDPDFATQLEQIDKSLVQS